MALFSARPRSLLRTPTPLEGGCSRPLAAVASLDPRASEDARSPGVLTSVRGEGLARAQHTVVGTATAAKRPREIVEAAVSKIGDALKRAAEDPKVDREIVLAAGSRTGDARRHAAEDLKVDREIVLAALSKREVHRSASSLAWAAGSISSRRSS